MNSAQLLSLPSHYYQPSRHAPRWLQQQRLWPWHPFHALRPGQLKKCLSMTPLVLPGFAADELRVGVRSRWAPFRCGDDDVRCALILANLRREGPMLAYVAVTDYELHHRSFYWASCRPNTKRRWGEDGITSGSGAWATTGKQSRLTWDVATSAVLWWGLKDEVCRERCRRQIHMAQQTGYENIAPRGPRKQGK